MTHLCGKTSDQLDHEAHLACELLDYLISSITDMETLLMIFNVEMDNILHFSCFDII